jgi:hypothetical protein
MILLFRRLVNECFMARIATVCYGQVGRKRASPSAVLNLAQTSVLVKHAGVACCILGGRGMNSQCTAVDAVELQQLLILTLPMSPHMLKRYSSPALAVSYERSSILANPPHAHGYAFVKHVGDPRCGHSSSHPLTLLLGGVHHLELHPHMAVCWKYKQ